MQGRNKEVPPIKQLVLEVQPFSKHTQVPQYMGKIRVQCQWLPVQTATGCTARTGDAFHLRTQTAPQEMLRTQETNPNRNVRGHRCKREKIKPRLCIHPWRWAACVILQTAAPTRPRSICCLFSQFLSSKPGQLERKGVKNRGRRREGGGN